MKCHSLYKPLFLIKIFFCRITCKDYNDILLNNTNNKRRLHKVPDLKLNPSVSNTYYTYPY